ncbi:hypothetical protein VIGAN_02188100 [Vigna angularis var. angularis]|uniref:Secreted protein n=1 Tax=Vigna angularis var. angularis TaxID=157739 RepID=A0A0S3REZ2_PHAAN|nr:hypothetical protein VIGAN_02188100 [Vigna angularis var. angularis]
MLMGHRMLSVLAAAPACFSMLMGLRVNTSCWTCSSFTRDASLTLLDAPLLWMREAQRAKLIPKLCSALLPSFRDLSLLLHGTPCLQPAGPHVHKGTSSS